MQELFEVEKVKISREEAQDFEQDDFSEKAFQLLKEVGIHGSYVSSLIPQGQHGWKKYQAIVGGHLIRSNKLIRATLDQASQRRMEIIHIYFRLIYECTVNARYLILKNNPEIFESYIKYSLRNDKRLRDRIKENMKEGNRDEVPIEKRMTKSIEKYFKKGGYTFEEIDASNRQPWGGDNIYYRAKELNMNRAHLFMFKGQSSPIHGNWHDLVLYHLNQNGNGEFEPVQEWHSPDIRIINSISILTVPLFKDFVTYLAGEEIEEINNLYDELLERILLLEKLHEEQLQKIT
jgi:hypothetical protein